MPRIATGILVFRDVEILDFCGPFEVFTCTRLEEMDRRDSKSPFEVSLIAVEEPSVREPDGKAPAPEEPAAEAARAPASSRGAAGWIRTSGGMEVRPHHRLGAAPALDLLVVPGGWGVRDHLENHELLRWLAATAAAGTLMTSVCTGAMLLGQAGLLAGKRATTHWQSLDWMRASFPGVEVIENERFVDEGPVVTAAGISAGIDMALHVVARFFGETVARRTRRYMQYAPPGVSPPPLR